MAAPRLGNPAPTARGVGTHAQTPPPAGRPAPRACRKEPRTHRVRGLGHPTRWIGRGGSVHGTPSAARRPHGCDPPGELRANGAGASLPPGVASRLATRRAVCGVPVPAPAGCGALLAALHRRDPTPTVRGAPRRPASRPRGSGCACPRQLQISRQRRGASLPPAVAARPRPSACHLPQGWSRTAAPDGNSSPARRPFHSARLVRSSVSQGRR